MICHSRLYITLGKEDYVITLSVGYTTKGL